MDHMLIGPLTGFASNKIFVSCDRSKKSSSQAQKRFLKLFVAAATTPLALTRVWERDFEHGYDEKIGGTLKKMKEMRCPVKIKPEDEKCETCGEENERLLFCGRCRSVQYCGKECQVADWSKKHKWICKELRKHGFED